MQDGTLLWTRLPEVGSYLQMYNVENAKNPPEIQTTGAISTGPGNFHAGYILGVNVILSDKG